MIFAMDNWKIVHVHGGGVCLIGQVDGKERQSTNLVRVNGNMVTTKSGTIYRLNAKLPGMWEMQLSTKRPSEYANLQKHGLVG